MKTRKIFSIFTIIISYFILGGMVAPINSLFQIKVNDIPKQVVVNEMVEIKSEIKNRALMLQDIRFGDDILTITVDNESLETQFRYAMSYTQTILPFESRNQSTFISFSSPGVHKVNICARFYIGDELITYEETIYIEVIE